MAKDKVGKDKKAKEEEKKKRAAEKKRKQEKKGEKKEKAKSKADESDAEDVDLDAVLAEYAKKQEQFLKVTEAPCDPPRPRASTTLIPSPSNSNELFLFGGEYFNGALASFFNDLYVYLIDRSQWRLVTSPNTPLPRSGHAWTRGGNTNAIYLFGGEFSSPKQGTFYHYNDFWRLDPSSREWTRLESKGKSPPARSGHRMTYYKNYIILFGGFQDTSQQTKYLADIWLYDTQTFTWSSPAPPPNTQKPDARSSFTFLPTDTGAVLFGGYSRVKASVAISASGKGGKSKSGGNSQASRNVLKPLVHQDCFYLRITVPATTAAEGTPPTLRWERRKRPANIPVPARAGATMAFHKGRGIAFGGVHDVEESEEGIESEFFDTLTAWNIERNRYFGLTMRKPRVTKKATGNERGGGRRGRGQANEEELLRNLAALEAGGSLAKASEMDIDPVAKDVDEDEDARKEIVLTLDLPHPRFNAALAVQDDTLFIYGGTFEKGDREFTFDDMYSVDLGKLDGMRELFKREPENWLGSEDGDSEEDDDEEDGEDDSEDDEDDAPMEETPRLYTESTRKSKHKLTDSLSTADASIDASASTTSTDELEADEPATPDDGLPHPRPFESRREFFTRTGNEWQEALMAALRWQGVQPETLSIKEIKTRAFEMSEAKWWDCREEVAVLEEEQEAAGIGEVVVLGERGDGGAGAGAGGRRR